MDVTKRMSLCYKIIIIAVLMTDLVNSQSSDELQVFTCEGTCGQDIDLAPCSCQDICVVYETCCENMTTYCPQIVAEGRLKFGHLLESEIMCYEPAGHFIISSCPHLRGNTSRNLDVDNTKSVRTNTLTPERKQTVEDVFFNNVIVTDVSTKISYLNHKIFLCNGGNLSNVITWEIASNDKLRFGGTQGNQYFTFASMHLDYQPSKSMSDLSKCQPEQKPVTCWDKGRVLQQPELEHLCENFTSYVKTKLFEIYKNRFCVLCSENAGVPYSISYMPPKGRDVNKLSLLMSLSSRSAVTMTVFSSQMPIRRMICPLNVTNDGMDLKEEKKNDMSLFGLGKSMPHLQATEFHCQTIECLEPQTKLRPDGTCKELRNIFLALPLYEYPLSKQELDILPKYFNCSFRNYLETEDIHIVKPIRIQSDISLGQPVYSFIFKTWVNRGESEDIRRFAKLLIVCKTLKKYISEKQISDRKTKHDISTDKLIEGTNIKSTIRLSDNFLRIFLIERGKVLNNVSIVYFCWNQWDDSVNGYQITPGCFRDEIYETDFNETEEFSKFQCLSLFTNKSRSVLRQEIPVVVIMFLMFWSLCE